MKLELQSVKRTTAAPASSVMDAGTVLLNDDPALNPQMCILLPPWWIPHRCSHNASRYSCLCEGTPCRRVSSSTLLRVHRAHCLGERGAWLESHIVRRVAQIGAHLAMHEAEELAI